MNDTAMMSASHAVYSLRLHIVFVTKYRRKTLAPELLDALREAFAEILTDWRCTLIEFGGEADHVHLLVGIQWESPRLQRSLQGDLVHHRLPHLLQISS